MRTGAPFPLATPEWRSERKGSDRIADEFLCWGLPSMKRLSTPRKVRWRIDQKLGDELRLKLE
jgi:hypothetical protein